MSLQWFMSLVRWKVKEHRVYHEDTLLKAIECLKKPDPALDYTMVALESDQALKSLAERFKKDYYGEEAP